MRSAVVGAAACAVLVGAVACGGDADDLLRLDPPPPEPGALRIEQDDLPASSISVPVDVSLAILSEAMEGALPTSIGSLDDRTTLPDNDRMSLAYEISRGPIETWFEDGRAHVAATLGYRVRAWYDPPVLPAVGGSCGTDEDSEPPRLRVELQSPITLDRDWRIRTDVSAETIRPASDESRDKCEMTILDIDVTGRVIDGAHAALASLAGEINEMVSGVDVRSDFASWWATIAEPVRLADRAWLVLSPDSVGRSAITAESGEVFTTLTLHARPRVVMGDRPDVTVSPLPPLDSTAVRTDGVRVVAEAVASWGEITRRLREEVVGRSFEARGRTLRVEDLIVDGVGDGRASVRADLGGDVRGTVFLVGTPTYDAGRDEIHVDDLDFDVRTRDAIVTGAAWITRAGLLGAVRSAARFPAGEVREWALAKVEEGFNVQISSQVRLEGNADEVSIASVHVGPDAVRVRAVVTGDARLVVEPS